MQLPALRLPSCAIYAKKILLHSMNVGMTRKQVVIGMNIDD